MPAWLTLPPMTLLPAFFDTGIASPVMNDSSAVDRPKTTRPSAGILAPGSTLSVSPRCSRWMSICCSLRMPPRVASSVTRMAVFACRHMSADSASLVLPLAMCSSQRPRLMNSMSMGGTSKKVIGLLGHASTTAATSTATL